MNEFRFNKVYVIESLDESEEKQTGKELHDDLLRWKEMQIDLLNVELIQVTNRIEFFKKLEYIKDECTTNSFYPIIHFEIHGAESKKGLVLQSGELLTWIELYNDLVAINSIVGNNLFMTMAVCYGAYIMELIKIENPAPFWGFIGSFDEISVSDLMIRYNEFYNDFLTDLDLNKAIEVLHNSNPDIPSDYRFINSEQTFKNINTKYFKEKFSNEQIKIRFEDGLKQNNLNIKDRNEKNRMRIKFRIELNQSKKEIFEEHKRKFFMLDNFPSNIKRFPVTFEEMNNKNVS